MTGSTYGYASRSAPATLAYGSGPTSGYVTGACFLRISYLCSYWLGMDQLQGIDLRLDLLLGLKIDPVAVGDFPGDGSPSYEDSPLKLERGSYPTPDNKNRLSQLAVADRASLHLAFDLSGEGILDCFGDRRSRRKSFPLSSKRVWLKHPQSD